jgi:hypothetical protein
MMEYRNLTQFPSLAYEAVDQYDEEFHVAVMRITMEIGPDGALAVAGEQPPLAVTDDYYGEMHKSSVKQESDLAPYKPRCDVIVIGTAYAPGLTPVPRFEAGIRITGSFEVDKRLTYTGPRFWEKQEAGWVLTEPLPIVSLPLRYEYAYGGACRIEKEDPAAARIEAAYRLSPEQRQQHPDGPDNAPVAHTAYDANPIGAGYIEDWYLKAKGVTRIPAPQIESPDEPITELGKHYAPQGLGAITRAWLPRRDLCGTIDEAFVASDRWLPEDFDFAFWNGAHPDLQTPWLKGDETIELFNIGEKHVRLTLPGSKPYALARLEDGQIVPLDFALDTLLIDTDQRRLTLLYRLLLPKEPAIRVLEARMMSKKEQDVLDALIKDKREKASRDEMSREASHG